VAACCSSPGHVVSFFAASWDFLMSLFFLWKLRCLKHFPSWNDDLCWLFWQFFYICYYPWPRQWESCLHVGAVDWAFQSPNNARNKTPHPTGSRGFRCRAGKWRQRGRKFNQFLPLIIMGNVRSLADEMDRIGVLTRSQGENQEGNICFTSVSCCCDVWDCQLSCCQATETTPRSTDGDLWGFLPHLFLSHCNFLSVCQLIFDLIYFVVYF